MLSAFGFYTLPLSDLDSFLGAVASGKTELIAPVKTDLVRFVPVTDPASINLKEQAFFPVKEYFFRKNETLFTYDKKGVHAPDLKPKSRVFFGLRRCDLGGIERQDTVFLEGHYRDPYYAAQRSGSVLIGYHCNTAPSKWCFCGSMDLEDFYDIMFWRKKDHYLVHVKTKAGAVFFLKHRKFFTKTKHELTSKDRKTPKTDLLKRRDLSDLYDHPDWQKGCDKCVSCSACTALCPTCFCHEIKEEPSLASPGTGKRSRGWSSCQLTSFSRVAGNHIFRKSRLARFKHRIFHQLQYFREQHGIDLCTGCGRCISGCPTRIDFLSIINDMKEPKKKKGVTIPLSIERKSSSESAA